MMLRLLTVKTDSTVGLFQPSNILLIVLNVEFLKIYFKAFDILFYYRYDFQVI